MFIYVATCGFAFPSGNCFIQTMAGWTLSVCFVVVNHEDHLLLRAAGCCRSSSVVLEYSRFGCWKETIYSSSVSDELWGSVLSAGCLGEWQGERLWSVRGGPSFCVKGCRQPLCHHNIFLFPPRHSLQPPRGLRLSDEKNKSHGQAAKLPLFGLVTFLDLLNWN